MPGRKHEPDIDTYAIGSADRLEVDFIGGTYTVHFDLKQIKENDFIRYYIKEFAHGVYFDTDPVPDSKSIAQHWVEDIDSRTREEIRAVLVPEYVADSFKDLEGYKVLYT